MIPQLVKSVHFKNTVAKSSFFSKLWYSCSICDKNEDDIVEIHLSLQPGNEYDLASVLEWTKDDDDQLLPLVKNNNEGAHQANQPPTWIGIN